jgi:hypothetical protein
VWGELVFSRAAVSVSCHPSFQILEGVADRSRLYVTDRRMRRDVVNLSHGWGSNSRWRTSFRFDYEEKDLRMPWNDTLALRRTQAPWPLQEGLLVRRENL